MVTPVSIFPLKPSLAFLCNTILMIPLIPSGLYLAEGLVINSIVFIEVDGICFRSCAGSILVGLPSIRIRTLEFPRSAILPFWSTFTEGTLFIISEALAPVVVRSFPTFITLRSILCSMVVRSATTVTPSNIATSGSNSILPKLYVL